MAGVSELALMGRVVKMEDDERFASLERVAKADGSRQWEGANSLAAGTGGLAAAGAGGYAGFQGLAARGNRMRAAASSKKAGLAASSEQAYMGEAAEKRRAAQRADVKARGFEQQRAAYSRPSTVTPRPADIGSRPTMPRHKGVVRGWMPGEKATRLRANLEAGRAREAWDKAKPGYDRQMRSHQRTQQLANARTTAGRAAESQSLGAKMTAAINNSAADKLDVHAQAQGAARQAAQGNADAATARRAKNLRRMKGGGKVALGGAGLVGLAGISDVVRRRRDDRV